MAVVDPGAQGTAQPYHFARELPLEGAQSHLASCAKRSRELAAGGLADLVERLRGSGYQVAGCAILTSSGRPLPGLAETLASHAMIHTAEGEFFRTAFADACSQLGIPVARERERDMLGCATREFGSGLAGIKKRLAAIGGDFGPPWAEDQKKAALAGWLLLSRSSKAGRRAGNRK